MTPSPVTDTFPLPPVDDGAAAALLRARFAEARAGGLRHKDAAESIGLREGAALAAHLGTPGAGLRTVRLRGPWIDLLRHLEPCGPLMALTRNGAAVHEKTGVYRALSAHGAVGLALGEEIDLRLFFSHWHAGFAVYEPPAAPGEPAPLPSLQFFDAEGVAVHKIHPRPGTDATAWRAVAEDFADTRPGAPHFAAPAPAPGPRPDEAIDVAAFADGWAALRDTHAFFGLLKQHGVDRQQGLRLMEGRFTRRLPTSALRRVLLAAASDGTPIMVFVGNPGCIQIHIGPVHRVEPLGPWINVLDAGFNLHVREDTLAAAWLVEKPTDDGTVTALEVFDAQARLVVQCFGARKPGRPEDDAWRALVAPLRPAR